MSRESHISRETKSTKILYITHHEKYHTYHVDKYFLLHVICVNCCGDQGPHHIGELWCVSFHVNCEIFSIWVPHRGPYPFLGWRTVGSVNGCHWWYLTISIGRMTDGGLEAPTPIRPEDGWEFWTWRHPTDDVRTDGVSSTRTPSVWFKKMGTWRFQEYTSGHIFRNVLFPSRCLVTVVFSGLS